MQEWGRAPDDETRENEVSVEANASIIGVKRSGRN
jgi:hypothetical protein